MYLTLPTARLFFDTVGPALDPGVGTVAERPTLLVLHGGPGADHMSLRPHFDRYADMAQVIYIDHRGCGRSTGDPGTWTLDQWADDIAAFCDSLGVTNPMVFGQSFGGMVAMWFAARYPDRVRKLVLSSTAAKFRIDATVDMARQLGGDRAADVAHRFFSDPTLAGYEEYEAVCLPLYSRTKSPDGASFRDRSIQRPEVTVHFFQHEMLDMDLRPGLSVISCPTLVLAGGLDPVTPVVCSTDIAKAIGANAKLVVFDDCGHGVHRDDPDGSETVMRTFLQEATTP